MAGLASIFVSYGSPMLALDAGADGLCWQRLAQSMPQPRAVVIVSALWSTPVTQLGTYARPPSLHDFYGFPAALYRIQYRPPGAPQLAAQLAARLEEMGWPAGCDPLRGLDHGAWIPLRAMYPQADVPVIPLSCNAQRGPEYHLRLGLALRKVLPDDVLLIASGHLAHGLHDLRADLGDGEPAGQAGDFRDWLMARRREQDVALLLDCRRQARDIMRAHPRKEHLLPLFVALGAGTGKGHHHCGAIGAHGFALDVYSFGQLPAATEQP